MYLYAFTTRYSRPVPPLPPVLNRRFPVPLLLCVLRVFIVSQEDYAIALFVVGLAATAVGQIVVNHLVKKVSFWSVGPCGGLPSAVKLVVGWLLPFRKDGRRTATRRPNLIASILLCYIYNGECGGLTFYIVWCFDLFCASMPHPAYMKWRVASLPLCLCVAK